MKVEPVLYEHYRTHVLADGDDDGDEVLHADSLVRGYLYYKYHVKAIKYIEGHKTK